MSRSYLTLGQYKRDEQDEFSETECFIENPISESKRKSIAELFNAKQINGIQRRNSTETYHSPQISGYCQSQNRQIRPMRSCLCNLQIDPSYCCYESIDSNNRNIHQESQHKIPSHVTNRIHGMRLSRKESTHNKFVPTVKKYPVTTRTPRYFRLQTTSLYKRPSTLCLPITCRPDPATYKRSKKVNEQLYYLEHSPCTEYIKLPESSTTQNLSSDIDINTKLNDLEELLNKFGKDDDDEIEDVVIQHTNENCPLQKCKIKKVPKVSKQKLQPAVIEKGESNSKSIKSPKLQTQPQSHSEPDKEQFNNTTKNEAPLVSKKHSLHISSSLDDDSAIELHKSKTYIVNLIDKALSKELGTIPNEHCIKDQINYKSPTRAVNVMNRFAVPKSNKNSENNVVDEKHCCTGSPVCLRQLKKLRWNHLKHIQQETKRLVDLETFIESFAELEKT